MIVFPNCKINLGLHIIRKRTDGYHDLETIFYPVPLQDALEIISDPSAADHSITLSGQHHHIPREDNLCVKACKLLQKDFSQIPFLKIHLHKIIPTGAGLGGGSADAAYTLLLLNQKFHLNLSEASLMQYALQLGSDCPFFIKNQPSFATGRGEDIEPVSIDLSGYKIFLVHPPIHIATSEAFQSIHPQKEKKSLKDIIKQPPKNWKYELTNDFEESVFKKYPVIEQLKEALYRGGAVYASMSGSGSAVFGLFQKDVTPDLRFQEDYFVQYI